TSSLSGKRSNRLSYRPHSYALAQMHPRDDHRCDASSRSHTTTIGLTGRAEIGYRTGCPCAKRVPDQGQSASRKVTSTPPDKWVTRLYTTAPPVARAVNSTTLIAPTSIV